MPSLLYELENNEALLLMFISGELPDDDRAEVEQMLSSDGSLRMELEEIRSAMADSMEAVAALDKLQPITVSAETIAIRGVTRAMKQWQVDRLRAQPIETPRRTLRYPMWVYPTSAVASILVGVLVWWGMSPPSYTDILRTAGVATPTYDHDSVASVPTDPIPSVSAPLVDGDEEKATLLENSFNGDSTLGDSTGLADAEAQARSLVSRTNDPTASIFPNELAQ